MISIGYTLALLSTGTLPWKDGKTFDSKREQHAHVANLKETVGVEEMCKKAQDPALSQYLSSVLSLSYDEEPDYDEYELLFMQAMARNGHPDKKPCYVAAMEEAVGEDG